MFCVNLGIDVSVVIIIAVRSLRNTSCWFVLLCGCAVQLASSESPQKQVEARVATLSYDDCEGYAKKITQLQPKELDDEYLKQCCEILHSVDPDYLPLVCGMLEPTLVKCILDHDDQEPSLWDKLESELILPIDWGFSKRALKQGLALNKEMREELKNMRPDVRASNLLMIDPEQREVIFRQYPTLAKEFVWIFNNRKIEESYKQCAKDAVTGLLENDKSADCYSRHPKVWESAPAGFYVIDTRDDDDDEGSDQGLAHLLVHISQQ